MALFTALIAYVGNKLATILQAVLGWSVTALFGRLPSTKQTALAVVLLLALLWPVMVVGVFVPAVSAWAFAFVPLQKWIGGAVVRWVSLGVALVLPPIVGVTTRWVAPAAKDASAFATIVASYPLTLGYAVACLVTAVSVPVVRAASAARGWADEHVFVQPRASEYDLALGELSRACAAAGTEVRVERVPARMMIATTVLKWFARALVRPIVAEDPKMLRGDALELYLYPADLLLRGAKDKVARVRASMTRTWLERYAFVVSDPGAQALQDELQRMWAVIGRHRDPKHIGRAATSRLREVARDLSRTSVPFDQWVMLDRSLHRLERALGGGEDLLRDDLAVRSVWKDDSSEDSAMPESIVPPPAEATPTRPMEEESTAELIRDALDETRDLVRLEVALAREELRGELLRAKTGGLALGVAGGAALSAFTMFMVTIALAFAWSWLAALIIGGILLFAAGLAGLGGWKTMPKRPLAETKERIESDLKQLKERVA